MFDLLCPWIVDLMSCHSLGGVRVRVSGLEQEEKDSNSDSVMKLIGWPEAER